MLLSDQASHRVRNLFFVTFFALCSYHGVAQVSLSRRMTPALTISEAYLFSAANQERIANGLLPLKWNASLAIAARVHAARMAHEQAISHRFAGENSLALRAKATGALFSTVAENVAVAPTAVALHQAWMNSAGHRANILDSHVTSVGVAVFVQGRDLWAVQDFARDVQAMTLNQQEEQVVSALTALGVNASISGAARQTCSMKSSYAGNRRPSFVMRYSATELAAIPDQLKSKIRAGDTDAEVGACAPSVAGAFSAYNIAIVLYP